MAVRKNKKKKQKKSVVEREELEEMKGKNVGKKICCVFAVHQNKTAKKKKSGKGDFLEIPEFYTTPKNTIFADILLAQF